MADVDFHLKDMRTGHVYPIKLHDNADTTYSLTLNAAALPLPAGAATSALQLADGHNVTVDNAVAGAAVNVQDGGNTLTVDGTVTANQGSAGASTWPVAESGGAYVTPTHSAPTAGVATGVILAANANRLYALIVNDSDTTVYLALGVAAAANTGIRLNANGGSYEMSKKLGNLYVGAVNGISGVAGKVVCVTEGV